MELYMIRVWWDKEGKHKSPWVGLFEGVTETEQAAKRLRAAARKSGRYFPGMVERAILRDIEFTEILERNLRGG
jgi:hypothetical protein